MLPGRASTPTRRFTLRSLPPLGHLVGPLSRGEDDGSPAGRLRHRRPRRPERTAQEPAPLLRRRHVLDPRGLLQAGRGSEQPDLARGVPAHGPFRLARQDGGSTNATWSWRSPGWNNSPPSTTSLGCAGRCTACRNHSPRTRPAQGPGSNRERRQRSWPLAARRLPRRPFEPWSTTASKPESTWTEVTSRR